MVPHDSNPQRGFTFIEMVAVVVVLMIVGGVGFQAIQMTGSASASTVFHSELDQRAHRAIARVVRDLQEAEIDSLLPEPEAPFGTATLDYRCAEISDDEESIVWGAYRRLACVPASTDPRDGRDNDNDGLVDEHALVLTYDVGLPTERTTVLVRNVCPLLEGETANALDDNGNGLMDETGFSLALIGGVLHVRLSLMGRSPKGEVVVRTAETTVWPRN